MSANGSTRRAARAVALVALVALGGCWTYVEDNCRGCVVVRDRAATVPTLPAGTRAVVILVHGAFGFGSEWRPVVDAARGKRHVALIAFAWEGPWTRKPTLAADALLRLVQGVVDAAPPATKVLVIAHSAGGALARYVAAKLRVPAGRPRVTIASIAGADVNVAAWHAEEKVDTPLGLAMGGAQEPIGPVADGVDYTEYDTADRDPAWTPHDGVHKVWLGKHVGHLPSVRLAGVPLVDAL